MRRPELLAGALTALLAACAPPVGEPGGEAEAHRQVDLARSLESAGDLAAAAHEYSIVAERYPSASVHPIAVRKAALLYALPDNPRRDDSLASRWLDTYASLPLSSPERELVQIAQILEGRVARLRAEGDAAALQRDSLQTALRRQAGQALAVSRRLQDAENELRTVSAELRKLKEVDVQTSRARRRR